MKEVRHGVKGKGDKIGMGLDAWFSGNEIQPPNYTTTPGSIVPLIPLAMHQLSSATSFSSVGFQNRSHHCQKPVGQTADILCCIEIQAKM